MAAPHSFPDLDAAKRAARAHALAVRAAIDPARLAAAGAALAGHVLRDCKPPQGAVVAGVWPLEGEVDLRPLLRALHQRGHIVVLPVTPPRGQPLTFRRWRPGDALLRERFGTLRPTGEVLVPDFLLVPLLAFDRRPYRLGYGGGYYDRTLAALPPGRFALGFGLAAQQVDAVPSGPNDVALDAIATEHGIIRWGKN